MSQTHLLFILNFNKFPYKMNFSIEDDVYPEFIKYLKIFVINLLFNGKFFSNFQLFSFINIISKI